MQVIFHTEQHKTAVLADKTYCAHMMTMMIIIIMLMIKLYMGYILVHVYIFCCYCVCVCVCGIFNGHPFCPQCLVILCAFTIKLTMNRTISLTQEHIHIGRTTFEVVLNRLFLSLSPFQHCSMKITVPNRLWACAIVTLSRCYSNGSSCEPCCGGAVNIFTISQKLTRWKLREKRKLQIVPDARVLIAGLAF